MPTELSIGRTPWEYNARIGLYGLHDAFYRSRRTFPKSHFIKSGRLNAGFQLP